MDRALSHGWSRVGERLVISFSMADPPNAARVVLVDGATGVRVATPWEAGDVAPEALWMGARTLVAGFREPRVWHWRAAGGALEAMATLQDVHAGVVARIDATRDEKRILIVDQNRAVLLVDGTSWRVLDRWTGPWSDGALAPGGAFAVGLAFGGALCAASLAGDRFGTPCELATQGPDVGVSVSDDAVAVAGSGEWRRAALRFPGSTP
jgi:hypothetical protein